MLFYQHNIAKIHIGYHLFGHYVLFKVKKKTLKNCFRVATQNKFKISNNNTQFSFHTLISTTDLGLEIKFNVQELHATNFIG